VKYEKDAQFDFGVALIMGNDGIEVGNRTPLFECVKRTVLSRVEYLSKIRGETYCVKGLVNDVEWVVSCGWGVGILKKMIQSS